MYNRSKSTK